MDRGSMNHKVAASFMNPDDQDPFRRDGAGRAM